MSARNLICWSVLILLAGCERKGPAVKSCLPCILLPFLITLAGCERSADPGPPDPEKDCALLVKDSNLIVQISERDDSLFLSMENNEIITMSTICISSYSVDTSHWRVRMVFTDSTVKQFPYFGSLEIPADSIHLNSFDHAPLTAVVNFTLPFPRGIKIRIHGRETDSPDLTQVFSEPAIIHSIPVYGLYADFNNKVTFSVLDNEGRERRHCTIALETSPTERIDCGPMTVYTNRHEDTLVPHFYLVQNTVYDAQGYIRWYSGYHGHKYFPLHDKLIAIQLFADKGGPTIPVEDIRVVSLLGQQVALYDVPHRNHHEIYEKIPGGNLLVATNAEPYYSTDDDTEDAIVELDRQTGEVVKFWDLRDYFDPTRPRIWTEMPNDWCHLNSIQYDSTDNTLLISSKLQSFISKIDYETGAIRWIFGNHQYWKEPWQSYLLEPLNFDTTSHPDQDWTYAQHMPRLTTEGHVIVYDNGRNRPGGDFARIHEFKADSIKKTVETIWTYDLGPSTRTMGSVHVLDNDNVLIGHGERGRVIEVNRSGEVVFEGKVKTFYRAYPFEFYVH